MTRSLYFIAENSIARPARDDPPQSAPTRSSVGPYRHVQLPNGSFFGLPETPWRILGDFISTIARARHPLELLAALHRVCLDEFSPDRMRLYARVTVAENLLRDSLPAGDRPRRLEVWYFSHSHLCPLDPILSTIAKAPELPPSETALSEAFDSLQSYPPGADLEVLIHNILQPFAAIRLEMGPLLEGRDVSLDRIGLLSPLVRRLSSETRAAIAILENAHHPGGAVVAPALSSFLSRIDAYPGFPERSWLTDLLSDGENLRPRPSVLGSSSFDEDWG